MDSAPDQAPFRLQVVIFLLAAATFTNLYVNQPVLPVLREEFGVDTVRVSFTVSAVLLGIALATLPAGIVADRFAIRPVVIIGGLVVSGAGLVAALSTSLWLLIGARFIQGLFFPALTTCVVAYLARTLPVERLNVVMGGYVSATVVGGMGGRLLGGFIHTPLHWRYAFVSAALLVLAATLAAARTLPDPVRGHAVIVRPVGFLELVRSRALLTMFLTGAAGHAVFAPVFNYLPFRLGAAPFGFSTEATTLAYLAYITGIFMGPLSGRVSNRFGNGATIIAGCLLLWGSLALLLASHILPVLLGLVGLCGGFFAIHAAAIGALNRRLTGGQGRANALYVLFYYVGGWLGITLAGFAYQYSGWFLLIGCAMLVLLVPLAAGLGEKTRGQGT